MEYLWTKSVKKPQFPSLEGNRQTDVLVIGGGMAGVLCALQLHEQGVEYLLAEGKEVGLGITKGTTAVVSAQHSTLYQDVIKYLGKERAQKYLHANLQMVEEFCERSKQIDCDFERRPSILYSVNDAQKMRHEARILRDLGYDAEFASEIPLPIDIAGAVKFPNMAQFHPLKFLYGVANGLNILENTFVTKLNGTTAITERGKICAKKVIICTHFPFINRRGMYMIKLSQKRSYVIALKNAPQLGVTLEEDEESGLYFRNYRDLLLIGGGDRRTGEKDGFSLARNFASLHFPESEEVYAWANQDCVSLDRIPYIGSYGSMENVYAATGFNHWGMSTSMLAAHLLTDRILGRKPVLDLDVHRDVFTKQLFGNLGSTVKNFATLKTKRCPHMGCAMRWNETEQSWDCPCHGSRFDAEGRLIDNPAMHDMPQ